MNNPKKSHSIDRLSRFRKFDIVAFDTKTSSLNSSIKPSRNTTSGLSESMVSMVKSDLV